MTIDDIFAALPEEPAQDAHEFLVIDPASRTIQVPDSESIFGVEGDEDGERKYFICPRYVGAHIDLAACFLSIVYRNANGETDQYLIKDTAVNGEYVTFSWLLSEKVVKYKGAVQFRFDADTAAGPAWGTTMAQGESLEGMEPEIDASTVEEQTSDVVTQLRDMVTRQTGNVEATGAAQVAAVKAQGTASTQEAVAAIQAQGAATLASIPAEYADLEATVDRLTRDRAAAIVCQAEGDLLQITDASNDPLQGLRIFGRSTQDGTPTPDAPVEIVSAGNSGKLRASVHGRNLLPYPFYDKTKTVNGVTFTDNGDGTITANGTATGYADFTLYKDTSKPLCSAGFLHGCPAGGSTDSFSLRVSDLVTKSGTDTGSGCGIYCDACYIFIRVLTGVTVNNLTFAPMVNIGLHALPFEKGASKQEFELETPGSLPGIPVASGGNYTDANGQQWIADEVDLARGVYVQRVGAVTLDASADEYWHTIQATGGTIFGIAISDAIAAGSSKKVYCSHFAASVNDAYNKTGNACYFYDKTLRICHMDIDTLDGFKAWLSETPVTVFYQMAKPAETPLTDVELQAYLALHSNKPTTTVLNDAGAHMVLEYAADPKTYIDNKLAALVAANN